MHDAIPVVWCKTLLQLFLAPAALDKSQVKVQSSAKWLVAGLLFLPLAIFSFQSATVAFLSLVVGGTQAYESASDSSVAVAFASAGIFVLVGLLGDRVPSSLVGKALVLTLLLGPTAFVGTVMLSTLSTQPLRMLDLAIILSVAMSIFYALNTNRTMLRFLPTLMFLAVTSLMVVSGVASAPCVVTQCLLGGLAMTAVALLSSSFAKAVAVLVLAVVVQGFIHGEASWYLLLALVALTAVSFLLTTVLSSTKDSEDTGGFSIERIVQTMVAFAVVAAFAAGFVCLTESGFSQILPSSSYLAPILVVSVSVLLQLWPNMLLSGCTGKIPMWFAVAGVSLPSYVPWVKCLGQTLPSWIPFLSKPLDFIGSFFGEDTIAREVFSNVLEVYLAFYVVGLVFQLAFLGPVSTSDAEDTSKHVLGQGISLQALSESYPMLATFLSGIFLLCVVAEPLQSLEVYASTKVIVPLVTSMVAAFSASFFFILALRIASSLQSNYVSGTTTLFSIGTFCVLIVAILHFVNAF